MCMHLGVVIGKLVEAGAGNPQRQEQFAAANTKTCQCFEGMLFLMQSNQARYGKLIQELANNCNKDRDTHPSTVMVVYKMMIHNVVQPRPRDSLEWLLVRLAFSLQSSLLRR